MSNRTKPKPRKPQRPIDSALLLPAVTFMLAALVFSTSAHAQSYTINRPGQLPTYVNPTPNGGYTINTPGQLPTQVTPTFNGDKFLKGFRDYLAGFLDKFRGTDSSHPDMLGGNGGFIQKEAYHQ